MSRPSPSLQLAAVARDEAPVLENLFQLYAHDFSEQVPLEIGADGRFNVTAGDAWWTRDDHFPFFLRAGDTLAGFALAARGSRVTTEPDVMDVAEFFVLRGARRQGIGTSAAQALFAAFRGPWEVRVRHGNHAALGFWARTVELAAGSFSRETFAAKGVDWDVLRFSSEGLR